jgi:hypothetical protein
MPEVAKSVDSRVPLGFLCAFLLFEYLRIQDLIPILGKTKIQTVFFALFVIVVFQQVSRSKEPTAPQFRLFLGFVALAFAQVPLVATNWFYAWQFGYGLVLVLVGCAAIAYIPRNEQDLKTFLGWLVAIHVCLAVLGIRGYSGNQFGDMVIRRPAASEEGSSATRTTPPWPCSSPCLWRSICFARPQP